jgi:flagellar hook-basal body complex protein FliE
MALAAPSTRKAAAKPARAQKAREEFEGTVEQALQKTVEKYRAAGHTVSEEMIPKIRGILREQLLKAHKAG